MIKRWGKYPFDLKAYLQLCALVCSYLRVPQTAGQLKILIFLVLIYHFPIYANNFGDAGQVPILRYFEACSHNFQSRYKQPY